MKKQLIVVLLLFYSVFGEGLLNIFDVPTPTPEPVAEILDIDKPKQKIIDRVSVFSDIIKDPTDRAKMAIFNYEFAERVVGYETTSQQVNDVYALAGKIFFKDKMAGKYEGLPEAIVSLLTELISEENKVVSEENKQKLKEYFMGVAWVLIQKG